MAGDILPNLTGPYDLVFVDHDIREYPGSLEHFPRILKPGGLLVSSNLFLGQYNPSMPGLEEAADYRKRILGDPWVTVLLPNGKALSLRS